MAKIIFCLAAMLMAGSYAFAASQTEKEALSYIDNHDITNEIPYFDNRFRIDAKVDEIILIFYRKKGSQPVILIQPNGAKYKVNDYPEESVQWYDGIAFDMIKIQKPTPGPWQVIGRVLPKSKIMVVSQIKLVADPLPKLLLAGETLKVTAKLYNGSHLIEQPAFREVVDLQVDFYSTNNIKYGNFGADHVKLTTFRDDGKALDEHLGDGVFTGEFELKLAAGEWDPVYTIKLPMIERRLNENAVIVQAPPINLSVNATTNTLEHHHLYFEIDERVVKPGSMIFQGKITYPNKEVDIFSLLENEGGDDIKKRLLKVGYREPGVHRVNVSVFGETLTGREFRLTLPEFTFNVETTTLTASGLDQNSVSDAESIAEKIKKRTLAAEAELLALKEQRIVEQAEREQLQVYIIIAGNVFLLLIAGIGFWLYKRKVLNKSSKH